MFRTVSKSGTGSNKRNYEDRKGEINASIIHNTGSRNFYVSDLWFPDGTAGDLGFGTGGDGALSGPEVPDG